MFDIKLRAITNWSKACVQDLLEVSVIVAAPISLRRMYKKLCIRVK